MKQRIAHSLHASQMTQRQVRTDDGSRRARQQPRRIPQKNAMRPAYVPGRGDGNRARVTALPMRHNGNAGSATHGPIPSVAAHRDPLPILVIIWRIGEFH
jgi:hypothetical protein